MPIVYRIDHDAKLVVARGYGVITDEDVFGYQREVWSGKDVVGYNELVDMTDVSDILVPSTQRVKDLASVAAKTDPASPPTRFAIVAPGEVAFGLGRMFQTYRGLEKGATKEVRVLRTLDDALAFLRVSQPVALPPLP